MCVLLACLNVITFTAAPSACVNVLTPRLGCLSVRPRGWGGSVARDDTGYVGDGERGGGLSRGWGGEAHGTRGGGALRHLAADRVLGVHHQRAAGRYRVVHFAPAKATWIRYTAIEKMYTLHLQRQHRHVIPAKRRCTPCTCKGNMDTLYLLKEDVHLAPAKAT